MLSDSKFLWMPQTISLPCAADGRLEISCQKGAMKQTMGIFAVKNVRIEPEYFEDFDVDSFQNACVFAVPYSSKIL